MKWDVVSNSFLPYLHKMVMRFLVIIGVLLSTGSVLAQSLCELVKKKQYRLLEEDTVRFSLDDFIDTSEVAVRRRQDGSRWYSYSISTLYGGHSYAYVQKHSTGELSVTTTKDWSGPYRAAIEWHSRDSFKKCIDSFLFFVEPKPDDQYDSVRVNNLTAALSNHGSLFNRKYRTGLTVGDDRIPLIERTGLWMGGIDEDGEIHESVSANEFILSYNRQVDFVPGLYPFDHDSSYLDDNHIWKLNSSDLLNKTKGLPTENELDNWPQERLKQFTDLDNNGQYDAHIDAPCLMGDEMVYTQFTDMYNSEPDDRLNVGVNVQLQVFAFEGTNDEVLANTIFLRYTINNVSENDYTDFVVGLNSWFGLGYLHDNRTGCDTVNNFYYVYNADNRDDKYFKKGPPALGVAFLNHDMWAYRVYSGSPFVTQGYAYKKNDFFYYLNALNRIGGPQYPYQYGEHPHPEFPKKTTRYHFHGDITDTSGYVWNETNAGMRPGYRVGVGSIGPFDFKQGDTIVMDVAVVLSRVANNDNFENVAALGEWIKRLQQSYNETGFECQNPLGRLIPNQQQVSVFPTLTKGYLNVFTPLATEFAMYNTNGRLIQDGILRPGVNYIDIEDDLVQGIYIIQVLDGEEWKPFKFYKIPK